ncbi:hypothetical protein BH09MYX1_BH09MYX1_46130 [soil metagenome]
MTTDAVVALSPPAPPAPPAPPKPDFRRPLLAAIVVTGVIALTARFVPKGAVATVVGLEFLLATWILVWRGDDAAVRASGLGFSGVLLREPIDLRRIAKDTARALGLAFAVGALVFVPYYFGWRFWFHPKTSFFVYVRVADTANMVFGQLLLVALPEEAFYRGYLLTAFDRVFSPRFRVRFLGADLGPGLLVVSTIFALGHFLTVPSPARLAVFFPALVFGWMRNRTGGVGASVAFHALCNIFSETLGKGFAVY